MDKEALLMSTELSRWILLLTRSCSLSKLKSLSASSIVKRLGIHIRVAQGWVGCYYKDPESIL
ncbi:hypothetical protein RO3G_06086 [Rhizopus delemar RA 99-880]|uniref:Uncharacterized protein n=1 Tax=Rhizopus delemar (strain RA 99-880 / ATCC MYA-4621 / FGSC 9543 / NRRL 43880) TaxID=246409 RepID=I1BYV1_RHIO9|nr:hypothetical protein RO3G_06086 [Rhizopus delemar RA 99-880]|eukprot:EIE81381.1 hypothetical protein RO3G_06086 [Rhizopus delemar RA 99-880]